MGTAFVILLLLALCGFIAYIGDLLGRRLGKKRLSVFGLRPKHTAILLTIVTGVLIAGVTFAAAMASVPEFRRVVTQGERLVGRNRALARQIVEGKQRNEQLQAANTHLGTSNLQLQGENQKLQGENQQLAGTNKKLETTNRTLKEQSGALRHRNTELQAANTQFREANGRLIGATQRLQAEQSRLTARVGALRLSADRYRQKAGVYRLEATRYQNQAKFYRDEANTYQRAVHDYKNDAYLFRREDEIERTLVPPQAPMRKLRDAVENLLFVAEEKAKRRGSNRPRAIDLQPPKGYDGPRSASNEEILTWLVRQMAKSNRETIAMRLIATENSVAGRPIPARLDWYENVRVFAKNDEIARQVVDGGGDDVTELVFEDLLLFLRQDVRIASVQPPKSMIPDEEGVGKISYGQLLQAWLRIREINGRVVVRALAANDTLRSGPLNVKLEVTPVESAAGFSR